MSGLGLNGLGLNGLAENGNSRKKKEEKKEDFYMSHILVLLGVTVCTMMIYVC